MKHEELISWRALGALTALIVAVLLCPGNANAHRDDYLNETIVYLTLARSELEAEYWFDFGRETDASADFTRHHAAVEWGITDHWMVDGRVTVLSQEGEGTQFDSSRLESRYRFFDEGTLPVDIAVSFEVHSERESDGSTTVGIEPRLILSRDFGEQWNLTTNFSEEIPLDSESPAFLAALGARFTWSQLLRVGSEIQYDFGDRAGAVIPQLWFVFSPDVTLKLGYAFGVDREPEDFARIALEVEF